MARKRNYAREYQRRQELARERGFGSYYEERTAGATDLALARGHKGRSEFLAYLREGDIIMCDLRSVEVDDRYVKRYRRVPKLVIPEDGRPEREFILRNLSADELEEILDEEERRGVIFSPAPSLDQRRLLSVTTASQLEDFPPRGRKPGPRLPRRKSRAKPVTLKEHRERLARREKRRRRK